MNIPVVVDMPRLLQRIGDFVRFGHDKFTSGLKSNFMDWTMPLKHQHDSRIFDGCQYERSN